MILLQIRPERGMVSKIYKGPSLYAISAQGLGLLRGMKSYQGSESGSHTLDFPHRSFWSGGGTAVWLHDLSRHHPES